MDVHDLICPFSHGKKGREKGKGQDQTPKGTLTLLFYFSSLNKLRGRGGV
jgi:hypothetical protein